MNISYGKRLKLVRMAKNTPRSKMAYTLRISPSYYTRLENEERPVPEHIIKMLNLDDPLTFRWFYTILHLLDFSGNWAVSVEEAHEARDVIEKIFGLKEILWKS